MSMPLVDVEVIQVQQYAEHHPNEDLDVKPDPLPGEVGQERQEQQPPQVADDLAMDASIAGQKRPDSPSGDPDTAKKPRHGEGQPVTPPFDVDDEMLPTGERAPKTPRLAEAPQQKQMLQVTSTDLSLYEHEDSAVQFRFDDDDLDRLEQYEMEFYDDKSILLKTQAMSMPTCPTCWLS